MENTSVNSRPSSNYGENLNSLVHMKSLRQSKLWLWTRIGDVFGRNQPVDYGSATENQYSKSFDTFLQNWVYFATAELQADTDLDTLPMVQIEKIAGTFIKHSPELLIPKESEMSYSIGLLLGMYFIFHKSFVYHHESDDLQNLSLEKINQILQGTPEKHE